MALYENETILSKTIEEEMRTAYLDYAMSVIVARALPDIRDGMKPVQRRILYAMQELGLQHNRPYKKTVRTVGEVLGKYHPHGDSSVYGAMVRMAQTWSLRYPLVEGQGNFGSIDGDSPAAMRYTEARLQSIANYILKDIDKDTVNFRPNFDESLEEPEVLPTIIPNLLVNGANGIAVGMATNIPSHNLKEVINALQYIIRNNEATLDDIIKFIPAPDFPTGALIYGYKGVREAFETGKGSIKVRSKYHLEESKNKTSIIYTEIPYQVNKANLIQEIANKVKTADKGKDQELLKALLMIADLRDASTEKGIQIIVELKKDAIPDIVVNQLFKHTSLQTTFGANYLALVPDSHGKLRPQLLPLMSILKHFIAFRNEVVVRRTKFEVITAWKRSHILEGLNAISTSKDLLDQAISIIRQSTNREEASQKLQEQIQATSAIDIQSISILLSKKQNDDISNYVPPNKSADNRYYLTKIQADAILKMTLGQLTNIDRQKVVDEYKEIITKIYKLCDILNSRELQMDIIFNELEEAKNKFGDNRKTEIIYNTEELTNEAYIVNEDVVVTISNKGFIKRTPASNYRMQNRGGRGSKGTDTYDEDFIEHVFQAYTHHYLLFFTDKGKVYKIKVYDLPEQSKSAKGRGINNILTAKNIDEKVTAYLPIKEFNSNGFIIMCTQKGVVKKTVLSEFERVQQNGKIAVGLRDNDKLISAQITDGQADIILATRKGQACRFRENNIRSMGRTASGVRGINLTNDDIVVSMVVIKRLDTQLLTIAENGFGKRTNFEDFRLTNRGGKGVISMKITNKTGNVVRMISALDTQDLIVITTKGILIRQPISSIRTIGRNTQGVKLIRLDNGDTIADITTIAHSDQTESDIMKNNNLPTINNIEHINEENIVQIIDETDE
jgi:DNA gyrase subunit A